MSLATKAVGVENVEFKWGKKRAVGGNNKEIKFYSSFTYDGLEYTLYDSVYMYKIGEPEPFIGKLIKIWEHPDKRKKVKVLWYFRPWEIKNFLGNEQPLDNEIFLASGEGVGLVNINPLEAIAGKCNVVCTSEDNRNSQPSNEELQMADYIFYRTFHVGVLKISDKFDDKIAGVEVKFLFNKKLCETDSPSPNSLVVKDDTHGKDLLLKGKSLPGETTVSEADLDSSRGRITSSEKAIVFGDRSITHIDEKEVGVNKVALGQVKTGAKAKSLEDSGALDNRPLKNARVDDSTEVLEKNLNSNKESTFRINDAKGFISTVEKKKAGAVKDLRGQDKGVTSPRDFSEDRPSKKMKFDDSIRKSDHNNRNGLQNQQANSNRSDTKNVVSTTTSIEGKTKPGLAKDPLGEDTNLPPRKPKPDEKITKLSNGKLLKESTGKSFDLSNRSEGQGTEVNRRPDTDKSKWFKALPWEERIVNAHDQGTLVLIENLDPGYTSDEIKDVIWHCFNEKCEAKMFQRAATSSPHSGRAFLIFKAREVAENVVKKLDKGCLVLSNGRPLVGSIASLPSLLGKQSTFFGHLCVDKVKSQMQREMMKQAVSTSHCSQPNTIEYEMAMEWRLLQARSEGWWKGLYNQQGDRLRKLKAKLKSK